MVLAPHGQLSNRICTMGTAHAEQSAAMRCHARHFRRASARASAL